MKYFTLLLSILAPCAALAVETGKKPEVKVYGFVRGDFAIDTRKNVAANEGLFLLYPTDREPDANGDDLNAVAASGFYAFNSRLGINVGSMSLFNAALTGTLEADFAGFGGSLVSNSTVFRLRQAYIKMAWERSSLTVGQTWHPMFGPVTPEVISLSVGAPFNPFNRSPQLRYNHTFFDKLTLSGAAVYQFQFSSHGPEGKSNVYQRNAVVPELYFGADFKNEHIIAGAGVDYLTIAPRTRSEMGGNVYKADERLSSLSYTAYVKYTEKLFSVSAKSVYGRNLSDLTMLGGYGVSSIDPVTGEQGYTNFKHLSTWLGVSYGRKYKGSLFGGYVRNLGTDKALVADSPLYGEGLKLDDLYRLCGTFSYNLPYFSLGLEYEMTTAGYGDNGTFDYSRGRYDDTHNVTNHRVTAVISYLF